MTITEKDKVKKDFNLLNERKELFETELLGKITSAGRIYRKIRAQDKEFIKLLKEEFTFIGAHDIINKLAGESICQK